MAEKQQRINNQIRVPKIRLIDEDNEQRGIVNTIDALREAKEKDLDLVEIAPHAEPPACRIMNFGKFKYKKEKQLSKHRASQKKNTLKGIRLSLNMGPHDIQTRIKQATKFLEKGHKLRIEIILRGRERAHAQRAEEVVKGFGAKLEIPIVVEQEAKRQPNAINMLIRKK